MVAPDNAFEGSGAGTRGPAIARPAAPLVFGYAAYGAYWGAWAVMFAEYLAHRDLSMTAAGGLFSVTSVTAIATMVLIGGPAVRWPRARTTAVAFCLSAAGGIAVALADGAWLIPAFGLLGLGIGLVDVLVNIAGAELEARTRRPVLQIVHAAYGLGGGVAAVLTAVAVGRGATAAGVLVTVSALQAVAGAVAGALVAPGGRDAAAAPGGVALRALRGRRDLQAAAAIVLCAFFVEGSMDVWAVLFVRTDLDGPVLAAALAFAAFAGAVTVGRLFAARVLFGLGYERTLVISAGGSLGAGVLLVSARTPAVAGVAFLLLGFFLSVAAPAAFGGIGTRGAGAGTAVAAVTAVGYGGFVVGPPLLGWVADGLGLRAALGALVVAPACMLAAALLGRARVRTRSAR